MADVNEIVDVQISRTTLALEEADFNTSLFITNEQVFAERSRKYYNATDLITDGFDANGEAHADALAFFSQKPKPTQMIVGKRTATSQDLGLVDSDIKNNTIYTVTISNGVLTESATATSSATAEDDLASARTSILAALDTDMTAEFSLATQTLNIGVSITVPVAAGLTVVLDRVSIVGGSYETITDMYSAQVGHDNGWYTIAMYTKAEVDVLELAGLVEADYKLYIMSSANAENKLVIADGDSAVTDDIAGKLNELNFDRSAAIFNAFADSSYIESALTGKKLTTVPGASTWMFSNLSGQIADNLSPTESATLLGKNCNTYEKYIGVDMIRQGTVASGEFIDVMRGADELRNRIQVEVFRALVVEANGGSKIALTDEGVATLIGIVNAELARSAGVNFIQSKVTIQNAAGQDEVIPGYAVEADLASSIPANQRALRYAPDIRFSAILSGAIHKTVIRGVLSV